MGKVLNILVAIRDRDEQSINCAMHNQVCALHKYATVNGIGNRSYLL